jgi:hypothetical protein
VEVKIGIQHAARELVLDTDQAAEDVAAAVSAALAAENGVFTMTDTKGRHVLIPAAKLAYVEIGTSMAGAVGFRS